MIPSEKNPFPPPRVAAIIATHRRDEELQRLLDGLALSTVPMTAGAYVADNANSPETQALCAAAPLPCVWIGRTENNGPGAAWNTAISKALEDPNVTHLLVLDDDIVLPPDALAALMKALTRTNSAAAAPLLFDDHNRLWGFPEPVDKPLREAIRRVHTPEECAAVFGERAYPFFWATGACMLYTREAFAKVGFFREDFWMLGEDLDFSMRVAAAGGGVFTAQAAVSHLPPPPRSRTAPSANRNKFLALLQNLSFLAFHSPHSAHLRHYLLGNFRRYLRTEGYRLGNMHDMTQAFWHGAVRGQPAGTASGFKLRARTERRPAAVWGE